MDDNNDLIAIPQALNFNKPNDKNDLVSDEKHVKELFNPIYDSDPYALFLRGNFYLYDKKEYDSALLELNKAILAVEKRKNGGKLFTVNEFCSYTGFEVLYKFQYRLYSCIAEAYSKLNDNVAAFNYYKQARYYSIQFSTEFEKLNEISLYSFRPISRYALADLAKNSITVCNPKLMNDPFDSLFIHWATKENFEILCENKEHIQPLIDSYKYFKIRSFSENSNSETNSSIIENTSMWSHYAQNHEGFCIKYKFSKHFINSPSDEIQKHWYLKNVEYKKEPINLFKKESDTDILFATKSQHWENEHEIRLICYDPTCESDFTQIPLDSESNVEAIYFGYRCAANDIALIRKIMGEGIKYYVMKSDIQNIYRLHYCNL